MLRKIYCQLDDQKYFLLYIYIGWFQFLEVIQLHLWKGGTRQTILKVYEITKVIEIKKIVKENLLNWIVKCERALYKKKTNDCLKLKKNVLKLLRSVPFTDFRGISIRNLNLIFNCQAFFWLFLFYFAFNNVLKWLFVSLVFAPLKNSMIV